MHESSLPVQQTMEIITQALGTDKGTQNYENIWKWTQNFLIESNKYL